MDHTRSTRVSTGFRRLSVTLGTMAGVSVLIWMVFNTSPSKFCGEDLGAFLALVMFPSSQASSPGD